MFLGACSLRHPPLRGRERTDKEKKLGKWSDPHCNGGWVREGGGGGCKKYNKEQAHLLICEIYTRPGLELLCEVRQPLSKHRERSQPKISAWIS